MFSRLVFPGKCRFEGPGFVRVLLAGMVVATAASPAGAQVQNWDTDGNAISSGDFIGTTNSYSFDLKAYGYRAFRLTGHSTSPMVVGGNSSNSATSGAYGATISGGGDSANPNVVTDVYGTVGGGRLNYAGDSAGTVTDAPAATVGGGQYNRAQQDYATVGGGRNNTASATYSTICGGYDNSASGNYSTVAGGTGNSAANGNATVGGGSANEASGASSLVAGGIGNEASYNAATVAGGNHNTASGSEATVAGGYYNQATSLSATVAGGEVNLASGWYASVGGGNGNAATATSTTVAGGADNTIEGPYGTICGGASNYIPEYATYGVITGGSGNAVGGLADYPVVGGGLSNAANGDYATVPGGRLNEADGEYSFAAGRRAKADSAGCFAWADSYDADFSCSTANQFDVRAGGGLYFYTSSDLSTYIYASTGNAFWSYSSDRDLKEGFEPVEPEEVLERLAGLPIATWSFRASPIHDRHMGPMAQDFHAAFGLGDDPRRITSIDESGVAFAAIQGLLARLRRAESRIAKLEEQRGWAKRAGAAKRSDHAVALALFAAAGGAVVVHRRRRGQKNARSGE